MGWIVGTPAARAAAAILPLVVLGGCAPEPAAPEFTTHGVADPPAAGCVPDETAGLSVAELPVVLAAQTAFRWVEGPVEVPPLTDGRWDLGPVDGDDHRAIGPQAPAGQWWADRFTDAEYGAPLDLQSGTSGVFKTDSQGTQILLGLVSATPEATALHYDPPVPFLPLPLAPPASWEAEAEATGVVDGQPYPRDEGAAGTVSLRHRYSFEVTDEAVASLPAFDVRAVELRAAVRVEAWNSLAGLFATDTERVRSWFAPCLGLVARARSFEDEVEPAFTEARESMRVGAAWDVAP